MKDVHQKRIINNIDSTIKSICPEIWGKISSTSTAKLTENRLWKELVYCVLSSQVQADLSHAVTESIETAGLLNQNTPESVFEERLQEVLNTPVALSGRNVRYRFPNSKAKQIANARRKIYGAGLNLQNLLYVHSEPSEVRAKLIALVPGLGMKQASMYLRNVFVSYDLAVIDIHILRYMHLAGLIDKVPASITKKQYLIKEEKLKAYARKFNYPMGCVDFAIWTVMRVSSREGYLK